MPSSSTTRSPLEDTTNEPHSSTLTPPMATAKTGPVLHRKTSQCALHPQLDSSESYPSPHSSICEASIVRSSSENISWYDANDWAASKTTEQDPSTGQNTESSSWENNVLDSSGNVVPASFLQETPSPQKHTPHKLYPITEQNSLATLRPGASYTTLKGHPSASTIRPQTPGLNGKKQKSLSVSDLPPTTSPHRNINTPSPPPSPQSFYTPMEPHRPPPTRIPTPPGLPTFNKPEASTYRLPPPTLRFRDKFRSPTEAERQWMQQTAGLPKGVVMRGDNGVLVRGKFTPIRSGHFPPQRQVHALFRSPDGGGGGSMDSLRERSPPRPVTFDERRVLFTGPRMEPQPTTREGPVTATVMGEEAVGGKKRREERVERVVKKVYWVLFCCGLCEKWDLGAEEGEGAHRGFDGAGGETPLLVGGFNIRDR